MLKKYDFEKMPWFKIGATHFHVQLELPPNKDRAIKGLVICNSWDLEPWDLLNGPALGCYQPSLEVLIVSINDGWTNPKCRQASHKSNKKNTNKTLKCNFRKNLQIV